MAPRCAFGHSSEFILAKVTPQPGRVDVEITADYGSNPMIADEAEARTVLGKLLCVCTDGTTRELSAVAPLRFEKRTQVDPTAPLPSDPAATAEPHQLLCASWSWECGGRSMTFSMPPEVHQSVILWTPAASAGASPRWVFMIGGDVSPPVAVAAAPIAPVSPWILGGAVLGMSALVAGGIALGQRTRKPNSVAG